MSYQIQYDKHLKYKYPLTKFRKIYNKRILIITAILALIAIVVSPVREWIMGWILPANTEIASEAFSHMVSEVREGRPFEEAVVTFCKEILFNG